MKNLNKVFTISFWVVSIVTLFIDVQYSIAFGILAIVPAIYDPQK